jgi:putative transposase
VKHEWVYLRPATGIEQKRSLAEFFDWYNFRRPHQSLGWRIPNEAYLGQSTTVTALAAMPIRCCEFVDSRLRRSPPDRAAAPMDKSGETQCVPPPCPQVAGCPTSFTSRHNNTG